ncbi:MAG: tetratricopeptide repeat protein [Burkholderiaceae bacterium]|nr:tetratricopeptide repeat protein [Rhodoferax sp.]MCP5287196.1 tetratricopeptide repeat protein [Burkholderiaceae bacterium]
MDAWVRRWVRWCALTQLALGRPAAAQRLFERLLARWPHDLHAQASRAHLLALAGRWPEAEVTYLALLEASPDDAAAWFNLGWVREQRGNDDGAAAAFERATHADARLDRAWFGLGQVLARQHRLDGAAAALKRNTELQPMSPHGWVALAHVQRARGRADEAQRIVDHLQGFEPKAAAALQRDLGPVPAG